MGTGTREYTIQGVVDNILSNMEVIHTHVHENVDSTAAFFLAKHPETEEQDVLQGTIVGNYGNAVKMLSAAMANDDDIGEFIFDSVKHFLSCSGSMKVGVIKVSIGSKLGEKLGDLFRDQMANDNNVYKS